MAGLIDLTRFLGCDICTEMMQEDYNYGYGRSPRMLGGVRTCFAERFSCFAEAPVQAVLPGITAKVSSRRCSQEIYVTL